MLKSLSLCIGSLTVFVMVSAQPAAAQYDDMELRRLENQISELQDQIRELRVANAEMQRLLEAIAVAVLKDSAEGLIDRSDVNNCTIRLNDLIKKRDNLRTLGFSDKYPDLVNINKIISDLEKECAASGEAENK